LGDFAIAVFDEHRQTLTLARDPTGQVPLFFRVKGDRVGFATMPGALRDFGEQRSSLNPRKLACHLLGRDGLSDESFFCGVRTVRPGELVRIRDGSIDRRLHWSPAPAEAANRDIAALVEEYRDLLRSAVECRIKKERRIGAHLSSGLDSSAVAATAAMVKSKDQSLVVFTAAPLEEACDEQTRDRFADEAELAARTARRHGLRHIIIRETAPLRDVITRHTTLVQAPLWDPLNMCWWTQVRAAAAELGVSSILTGESGNLTLNAGGIGTLAAYLRKRGIYDWWQQANMFRRIGGGRWRGVLINTFGDRLPAFALRGLRRLFLHGPRTRKTFLRTDWLRSLDGYAVAFKPTGDPAADRLEAIRRGDLGLYRKAAQADRRIFERDPLADRRLIEFSLALPPEALLHDGIAKPLARAALTDRVPAEVLNQRMRGMQSADWHLKINSKIARQLFEETIQSGLFQELVDVAALDAAIDSWPIGGWSGYPATITYRNALTGTLATGMFIRLFER
jgi:asparagine synthase (glutamine-hydrolysing)